MRRVSARLYDSASGKVPLRWFNLGGMCRSRLLILLALGLSAVAAPRFPGKSWEKRRPASWSESGLKAARDYSATLKTAAVVIVQDGVIVDEWGDVEKEYLCHSMRKSFLSALYGIAVA